MNLVLKLLSLLLIGMPLTQLNAEQGNIQTNISEDQLVQLKQELCELKTKLVEVQQFNSIASTTARLVTMEYILHITGIIAAATVWSVPEVDLLNRIIASWMIFLITMCPRVTVSINSSIPPTQHHQTIKESHNDVKKTAVIVDTQLEPLNQECHANV